MAMNWKIDTTHSEILFKVKHLMITTVTGYFKKFDLEVETESEDFTSAKKIVFTADIDSIDTNNAQRDAHLKSAEFFNAEEHGQLRFVGTKYEAKGDEGKALRRPYHQWRNQTNHPQRRVRRNGGRSIRTVQSRVYGKWQDQSQRIWFNLECRNRSRKRGGQR